ncbi:HIT domain-containing protein [Streptomyces canus]|uniref:HIT family protein n=1 Tax=Streptomyces canus TaxID=58343 RepID=UPI002E2BCEF9|nr:HIT domain-containing protein [Streptomyces canus]
MTDVKAAEGRSCPFCRIVTRSLDAAVLHEDEDTLAFLDITAVTEGHTLVIPKRHAADLWEIAESDAVAVMRTAHRIAARLRSVLNPPGLTLFQANRPAGWQDVFHLHVHLVPRRPDDGLHRPWTAAPKPLAELEPLRTRLAVTGSPYPAAARHPAPFTSTRSHGGHRP